MKKTDKHKILANQQFKLGSIIKPIINSTINIISKKQI